MKKSRNFGIIFLILMITLIACTKKPTSFEVSYKEPLRFDVYRQYLDVELAPNYIKAVQDAWNNKLRYDEGIKNYTWLKGDYTVFAYFHNYTFMLHTTYSEVIFFTTTRPKKCTEKVYSTTTTFKAEFKDTIINLSRIRTYSYVNKYDPVISEKEAKNIMINYLDEYIEKYKDVPYDEYLIDNLKKSLINKNDSRDWFDHFVYYDPSHDFGGGIIINKLSSKFEFLGSTVFFGTGKRYFPED